MKQSIQACRSSRAVGRYPAATSAAAAGLSLLPQRELSLAAARKLMLAAQLAPK